MKKLLFSLSVFAASISFTKAQLPTINTIAGNGTLGFSGDGGQAVNAELKNPYNVSVDASGNVYIPDGFNNCVRVVNSAGVINTTVGNGTSGYSGDGGPATAAELKSPNAAIMDGSGNMYVADGGNGCIRKVDATGKISTIAGTGTQGYSGDGGPATAAELSFPTSLALDAAGNIYFTDLTNQRVRKIDGGGTIRTVAGNGTSGFSGDGANATAAELSNPFGVTVDGSGNLFIADQFNHRIREVTGGVINTIVGNGTAGYSGDGGAATSAELNRPFSVAVDGSGNMFIADYANNCIRKVNGGTITTIAGNGTAGFFGDGGQATASELHTPSGVAVSSLGNVYVSDQGNDRIRKITTSSAGINNITENNKVSVYPNPSNGRFMFEVKSDSPITMGMKSKSVIEVYSISGQKVCSSVLIVNTSEFVIDLTNQNSGIYIYKVVTEEGTLLSSGKIIKD